MVLFTSELPSALYITFFFEKYIVIYIASYSYVYTSIEPIKMRNVDGGAYAMKDLLVTTSCHNYYDWIMIFTRRV